MTRVGEHVVAVPERELILVEEAHDTLHGLMTPFPLMGGFRVLPFHEDSCRILHNMGLGGLGAAPFMFDTHPLVEGRYQPMEHQLLTAAFITVHPRSYVLSDPRTGKTGAIVLAGDWLQRRRRMTGGILVVTTVSTLWSVWADTIRATLPDAHVVVAHGPRREAALLEDADWFLTNYDSVRLSGHAFMRLVETRRVGMVVIDEVTHAGNVGAARTKAMKTLCKACDRVVGVTGSPGANPEMVWGMASTINPALLPCHTKGAWMGMVYYQYGPQVWQVAVRHEAAEIINRTLQPAIRYAKADILDLPPVVHRDMWADPTPEQRRVFRDLEREAIALVRDEVIEAASAGALYHRMMQAAQGVGVRPDGTVFEVDCKPRETALLEIIEESSSKVVVMAGYTAVIDRLASIIEGSVVVDGRVTGEKRAAVFRSFRDDPEVRVLVCHPTTTAFGVELAAADTLVFYGPPAQGGFIYEQALERLSSAKQKAESIAIINLGVSPAERKHFAGLAAGKRQSAIVNELFETLIKRS